MVLTSTQRATIDAIVSIFETGRLPSVGAYATTAVLADGAGISFGRHQATAKSGALIAIVRDFYDLGGQLGQWPLNEAINGVLMSVGRDPVGLPPRVVETMKRLRAAADDSRMRQAQDAVFERLFWGPALEYAARLELTLPLSALAVYDLAIHSGHGRIDTLRRAFPELPPSKGGSERPWTTALLEARHHWLSTHASAVIRRTSYRTESLLGLVGWDQWLLARPLVVRGVRIA